MPEISESVLNKIFTRHIGKIMSILNSTTLHTSIQKTIKRELWYTYEDVLNADKITNENEIENIDGNK